MKFTVKQFAEANNLQREDIYPLVMFLRGVGIVQDAGSAPRKEGVKGRTEAMFEADEQKVRLYLASLQFPNKG